MSAALTLVKGHMWVPGQAVGADAAQFFTHKEGRFPGESSWPVTFCGGKPLACKPNAVKDLSL